MAFPAAFISHGSPDVGLYPTPAREFLTGFGDQLGRPDAIVSISAHFSTHRPTVVSDVAPETLYDFSGFQDELYEMTYPAPGDPVLALKVAGLINAANMPVLMSEGRGYDHGTWIPLKMMYPGADIPIVQVSIQANEPPAHHFELGQALSSLREENILVLGTGAMTHNLRAMFQVMPGFEGMVPPIDGPPLPWVSEFADWFAERANSGAIDDLLAYRRKAPYGAENHPTDEHLLPFYVALGAGGEAVDARRVHHSIQYGVLAMDAYVMS